MKVKSEREVAQSCPTLSGPTDCSLPGSSIHGIFQARVLEWGAIAFSKLVAYPIPNVGLLLRRCSGKGLHLAMTGEPHGFSRVTAGFSSYDGEFRLPLVLAHCISEVIDISSRNLDFQLVLHPVQYFS